jgi:hypothetical protein
LIVVLSESNIIFWGYFFQADQNMENQLTESAAALEETYNRIKRGKEELEEKLNKAKNLREKISQLKSDFLSEKDLSQINDEMSVQRIIIFNSATAESEVKKYEEIIAEIKASGRIVSPADQVKIMSKIETMQKSVRNNAKAREETLEAEQDSGFCSQAEIEKLQKDLDSIQNVFDKLQPSSAGSVHNCHIMI